VAPPRLGQLSFSEGRAAAGLFFETQPLRAIKFISIAIEVSLDRKETLQ
jgi:hypothetical protein